MAEFMTGLSEAWNWLQINLDWLLGLNNYPINIWRMMVRALIVYICVLIIVRLGERRFMGKNTVFDFILGIVLGSVSSRAITDSAPFFPTLAASIILVGLHWLFAVLTFRFHRLGPIIKGMPQQLVKDGEIQWETMQEYHITQRDLNEYLRQNGDRDLESIDQVWLERNGQLSIIEKTKPASDLRIIEINVEEGVQTVRIVIDT